jgi:hypothetical protein
MHSAAGRRGSTAKKLGRAPRRRERRATGSVQNPVAIVSWFAAGTGAAIGGSHARGVDIVPSVSCLHKVCRINHGETIGTPVHCLVLFGSTGQRPSTTKRPIPWCSKRRQIVSYECPRSPVHASTVRNRKVVQCLHCRPVWPVGSVSVSVDSKSS